MQVPDSSPLVESLAACLARQNTCNIFSLLHFYSKRLLKSKTLQKTGNHRNHRDPFILVLLPHNLSGLMLHVFKILSAPCHAQCHHTNDQREPG